MFYCDRNMSTDETNSLIEQRRAKLDRAFTGRYGAQHLGQRNTVDVLQDQIQLAGGLAEIEHADQVRMLQRRVHARFRTKHAHEAIVHRQLRQDALERDTFGEAARPGTARLVHLGHAPGRNATHQLVFTEPHQRAGRTRLHQPLNVSDSYGKAM